MSDKVVTYKPFFFKAINTTEKKSKKSDRILNLDNYHNIERNGRNVSAVNYSGEGLRRTPVAQCNNENGARYVMDCIQRRHAVTEEEVISAEKRYDETTQYF